MHNTYIVPHAASAAAAALLCHRQSGRTAVLYSLTEIETEKEMYIFSLSETETEMFSKTETK